MSEMMRSRMRLVGKLGVEGAHVVLRKDSGAVIRLTNIEPADVAHIDGSIYVEVHGDAAWSAETYEVSEVRVERIERLAVPSATLMRLIMEGGVDELALRDLEGGDGQS